MMEGRILMLTALRLLPLPASWLGLSVLLHARTELPEAFCPAAAAAAQILALYLFALCGAPDLGVTAVLVIGCGALMWCLARERRAFAMLAHPALVFLLAYIAACAVLHRNVVLTRFDNYSHWALIVKEMCRTHALPGADTMVTFTNYPPATALWEYCAARLAGFREPTLVLALNALTGSLLACFFAGSAWRRLPELLLRALCALALPLMVPESAVNLQVDAALGLLALAMGCAAVENAEGALPDGASALFETLLGAVLLLTKTSGALLLALHLLLLLVLRRRGWRRVLPPLLIPAAFALTFRLRCRLVFGDALASNQFYLSPDTMRAALDGKSPAFRAAFPGQFLAALFDAEIPSAVFLMACGAAGLLVFILFCLHRPVRRGTRRVFACAALALVVYALGLAAMYVFVMDEFESAQLASFPRYLGTGVIYAAGLCYFALCAELEAAPRRAGAWYVLPLLLGAAGLLIPVVNALQPLSPGDAAFRAHGAELVETILTGADALQTPLADDTVPVYVSADYGDWFSRDHAYRIVRYAFLRRCVWPLDDVFVREEYLGGTEPCYLIWLGGGARQIDALRAAGIEPPGAHGYYRKGADGALTCLETLP